MARSHSGMTWKLKFRPVFLKFLPRGPQRPDPLRSTQIGMLRVASRT